MIFLATIFKESQKLQNPVTFSDRKLKLCLIPHNEQLLVLLPQTWTSVHAAMLDHLYLLL